MHLLHRIENHIRRYAIPPTRFGRDVVGDPRFVSDLRRGREPGPQTVKRVVEAIVRQESERG